MAENMIVLIRKPPYGSEEAFAGARLALGGLVSGALSRSDIILIGDGTLNALASQVPAAIGMPSNPEALESLMEMGGEVFCVIEDLELRVGETNVLEGIKLIHRTDVRGILDQYQIVNTY